MSILFVMSWLLLWPGTNPGSTSDATQIYRIDVTNSEMSASLDLQGILHDDHLDDQDYEGHFHANVEYLDNSQIDICAYTKDGKTEGEGLYYSPNFSARFSSLCVHKHEEMTAVMLQINEMIDFDENETSKRPLNVSEGDVLIFLFKKEGDSPFAVSVNKYFFLCPGSILDGLSDHSIVFDSKYWSRSWKF